MTDRKCECPRHDGKLYHAPSCPNRTPYKYENALDNARAEYRKIGK